MKLGQEQIIQIQDQKEKIVEKVKILLTVIKNLQDENFKSQTRIKNLIKDTIIDKATQEQMLINLDENYN